MLYSKYKKHTINNIKAIRYVGDNLNSTDIKIQHDRYMKLHNRDVGLKFRLLNGLYGYGKHV